LSFSKGDLIRDVAFTGARFKIVFRVFVGNPSEHSSCGMARCWEEMQAISVGTRVRVFISEVFRGEDIGLEKVEESFYRVYFCSLEVGEFDVGDMRFRPGLRA
jgi:hypothetical protein